MKTAVALSQSSMFGRTPPYSPEAERAVLGGILLDPAALEDVEAILGGPEAFYVAAHEHVYRACLQAHSEAGTIELVRVVDLLRAREVLDQVGGVGELAQMASEVVSSVNIVYHARLVATKARVRKMIDAAGMILHDCYHVSEKPNADAEELFDAAELRVFEVCKQHTTNEPETLAMLLEKELLRLENPIESGLMTGFTELDAMTNGMHPGEMVILAARPSQGKTALAMNIAEQAASYGTKGTPVGVFSMEMSRTALVQRLLSAASGVDAGLLRTGKFSDDEYKQLLAANARLKTTPILIDDTPNLTIAGLRSRARRMVMKHNVKVIVIDYLQLMEAPGQAKESRQVEVSAISRGIKALARELSVPVLCLSQLNRASESREGNRPRLSDLRESGAIEQDADVVMLLHREEQHHIGDEEWRRNNEDKVGVAELIVAKQRNGPTGAVKLHWDAACTRFRSFTVFGQTSSPTETRGKWWEKH